MKTIDLCSGIGGMALGFHRAGIETQCFVEIEPYAQKILKKNFPGVPIYDGIKKFKGQSTDIVSAGFPCPAFSRAGKQGGFEQDDLFFDVVRIIKESQPAFIILENVEGITKWSETIKSEIEAIGYSYESAILDGRDFGIPQARKRYFGLGVRAGVLPCSQYLRWIQRIKSKDFQPTLPYDKNAKGRWTPTVSSKEEWRAIFADCQRSGIIDGVPRRMDRMRCLGNSLHPQIAEHIGRHLVAVEAACGYTG